MEEKLLSSKAPYRNRCLRKKLRRMTSIIGFNCKEGVVLVSDTKITDLESGGEKYGNKLFAPIPRGAVIVGSAGYKHLAQQFNRRLPYLVNEKSMEVQNKNIKPLIESGLTREEAVNFMGSILKKFSESSLPIETAIRNEANKGLPLAFVPHFYTGEDLLRDCSDLVKDICSRKQEPYSLEILVGLKKNDRLATLHTIDWLGQEEEIEDFHCIGAGSPYVKMFFEPLYDYNKPILDLINLAFVTIAYTRDVAKENSVGFSDKFPPQAWAVLNDGRIGSFEFENLKEVLQSIKEKTDSIQDIVKNLNIKPLKTPPVKTNP